MKPSAATYDLIDVLSNAGDSTLGVAPLNDGLVYHAQRLSVLLGITEAREGPAKLFSGLLQLVSNSNAALTISSF